MSYLICEPKGEVLNFKELSWHTVRIEAKSTKNEDLTPLRLITNQARCRFGQSTPPMILCRCVHYRDCSPQVTAYSAENMHM